jgi:predicted regulator of Ras-like GTPase activity (Roadblock/LC7/MglB family)
MATVTESLTELMKTEGAIAAALVDSNSGMMLGSAGFGMDIELAAAGNTEVVRSKARTIRNLGLDDTIEDILITLGKQYHVLRPVARKPGIFVYLVLDRSRANLALSRRACQDAEESIEI